MKIVSQLDADGFYVGAAFADESPLEPGVFLLPGGCVDSNPPEVPEGFKARFEGGVFVLVGVPAEHEPEVVPLTEEQILAAFTAAIQKRLDDFARTRMYDGILSACTYVTSTVPKFKAEAQACVNLRDATWAAAYAILQDVETGDRPMPTSIADIESDLPALVWPSSF